MLFIYHLFNRFFKASKRSSQQQSCLDTLCLSSQQLFHRGHWIVSPCFSGSTEIDHNWNMGGHDGIIFIINKNLQPSKANNIIFCKQRPTGVVVIAWPTVCAAVHRDYFHGDSRWMNEKGGHVIFQNNSIIILYSYKPQIRRDIRFWMSGWQMYTKEVILCFSSTDA